MDRRLLLNGIGEPALAGNAVFDTARLRRPPFYSLADLLVLARYYWRVSVLLLAVTCLLGSIAIVLPPRAPSYTSDSLLVIAGAPGAAISGEAVIVGEQTGAIDAAITLLRGATLTRQVSETIGPATLFPALAERRALGLLPVLSPSEQRAEAARLLAAELGVERLPASDLVRVSFTHADQGVARATVAAIVDAYLTLQRTRYQHGGTERLAQWNDATMRRRAINDRIVQVQLDYRVLDITKDIKVALDRLDGILARDEQLRERNQTLRTDIAAARTQLAATPERVFDSEETAPLASEAARTTLLSLKLEREHLVAQDSATFPGVQELDRKITAADRMVQQASKPGVASTRYVRNPALDALRSRVAALELEAASLDRQLAELAVQFKLAVERVSSLQGAEQQLARLSAEKNALRDPGRTTGRHKEDVVAVDGMPQTEVHVVQLPQVVAGVAGYDLVLPASSAAALLGMLAIIATMRLRRTYVLPREAERDLGVPQLAEFPLVDPHLNSPESQRQVEGLADQLVDMRLNGRPLFAVQALVPGPADACAPIVRALAVELAQRHGLRTLVLDLQADRLLHVHALEGAAAGSALEDERHASPLRCGDKLSDDVPAGVLERLQERYDFVLISGDAETGAGPGIAALVDTNILLLRAAQTPIATARRLRNSIVARGGSMLGFVFAERHHYPPHLRWS